MTKTTIETCPVHLKLTLTINEAATYTGIGIHKIEEMLEKPDCDFRLNNGKRRMIKRKEFENYISRHTDI